MSVSMKDCGSTVQSTGGAVCIIYCIMIFRIFDLAWADISSLSTIVRKKQRLKLDGHFYLWVAHNRGS